MAKSSRIRTSRRQERVFVVSAQVRRQKSVWPVEDSLDELASLAEACGAEVVGRMSQMLNKYSPTYIGKGKIDDLRVAIQEEGADTVIFDDELKPSQQLRLEDDLKVKVIDRSTLILDVFARRARSSEGKLQIELAQSEYLLPRLAGQWSHLERLGGGIGTRGPGETQIETDRRLVRNKISRIKKELKKVRLRREGQRNNRRRSDLGVVAFVGYTNAGKSALFNKLTSSEVMERDQLFSTLDTTTRQIHLPSGAPATISDTVGFIYKLPPIVVESFGATLEELEEADVLVHVVDSNSEYSERQIEVVDKILDDMDLSHVPRILVLNKMDLLTDAEPDQPAAESYVSVNGDGDTAANSGDSSDVGVGLIERDPAEFGGDLRGEISCVVLASAIKGWGIDRLRCAIDDELKSAAERAELVAEAVG
ncbi:MAG: GTPase HflX [Dehalococcoidia bacterium]|nr:GTPase HflX [Dehalococcoidia bacterium]